MAKAYTKEFLLDAYISRFRRGGIPEDVCRKLLDNADKHYDKVGKEKFRVSASLDAEAIREYMNAKTLDS